MEKLTILSADLLDILFEYRNKLYGAYELRRTYHKRIVYAMGGTFLICLLFAAGTIFANAGKTVHIVDAGPDVILDPYEKVKPVEPPPAPPPPPVEVPVETLPHTNILIVNTDIPEDQLVQPVDDLDLARIGTEVQHGPGDIDIIAPPVEKTPPVAEGLKVTTEEEKNFIPVQIAARFPGDINDWTRYLQRNLNSNIPTQNGAPAGNYTVIVSFIVAKDGSISDVRTDNDPGWGTRAEAMRVIQKGPKWIPAEQNGIKVIYRHKQSITFQVREE